jgi:hypothetical protein
LRKNLLSLSLLLMASCGGTSTRTLPPSEEPGPADPATPADGGRRLRAVFLESQDGIGVFRHFQDTELDVSCNFVASDAGAWRCLPEAPDATLTPEIVYTDPECSQPLAAVYGSTVESFACAAPRYVVLSSTCAEGPSVFELGSQVSSDVRYRLVEGVCSISSSGTDYLTSLFAVTPVSLELFQVGRLRVGEETGGIVPVDVQSEDGARLRLGFRDAQEGFDCFLPDTEGDVRCLPKDVGLMGYLFADSGCSQPAAMGQSCAAERGELAFAKESSSGTTRYYQALARLSAGYAGTPERCEQDVNVLAFEVGSEVPITRFAAGQRTDVSAGNLTTTVHTVGTASLQANTLRSTAHGGHACHFALGADGELRCMPPPVRYPDYFFADESCSQPVEYVRGDILAVAVSGACPEQVLVYARGDRHAGPVYAISDGGGCSLAYDRPPSDSARSPYYVFPSPIPPSEFARLFQVER